MKHFIIYSSLAALTVPSLDRQGARGDRQIPAGLAVVRRALADRMVAGQASRMPEGNMSYDEIEAKHFK